MWRCVADRVPKKERNGRGRADVFANAGEVRLKHDSIMVPPIIAAYAVAF